VAGWLAWQGWAELDEGGPIRSSHAAQFQLAGPALLSFVLTVFLVEQVRPPFRLQARVLLRGAARGPLRGPAVHRQADGRSTVIMIEPWA
jgi:hypothetical protein